MKQLVDKKVQEKNGVNTTTVTQLTQGGTKLTQQQQINVILRQQQLIKEQQQQATLVLKGRVIGTSSSSSPQRSAFPRKGGLTGLIGKLKTPGGKDDSPASPGGTGAKNKVQEDQDEEEDHIDNFAGVNLKEETAHFLPAASDTPTKSISDETFLSTALLRNKVATIESRYGVTEITKEFLTFLSHATEERLRNLVEQVTVISQHRTELLKVCSHSTCTCTL
ncbi:PREDICTED: transcription initiation factor TFIID subunit 4B-like [Amphimedon queenslandica]|uniref:Transcription initiation factor TFIID component TAF4 C-terminal domain-containing protein n=1 Tax=Amphimedon queenslandica TaxID=400682 RepID=A0AAN0JXZ8_AMPQE|nr:PREDICTED: transcription initiation factor TFIID subunit 4B-like [Amphimedon queenslandica]|eukprot:XP_019861976.1 PREDICTED: transcription initiation factor TFIID subunit 4B-like [Amphimedon queenslandica]